MELIQELFVAVIVRWLHSHHLLWKANSNKHMLPSPHPTLHVSARYLLLPQWDHLALYAFSLPLTFECIPTLLFFFSKNGKRYPLYYFLKIFFRMVLYSFSRRCSKRPGIKGLNTMHIFYLTVSVGLELGMGSLRLLQDCYLVSARAVFSSGNSAGEGLASLLPWLLIAFHSLVLEDLWKLASQG